MQQSINRNQVVYLDNNSTTALSNGVKDRIRLVLNEYYNPSSLIYKEARCIKSVIKKARSDVAKIVNANRDDQIIFNSGATEGNNTVFYNCLMKNPSSEKHIIISAVEHSSVLNVAKYYAEKYNNIRLTILRTDDKGRISVEDLKNAVSNETVLVSIMLANNEIGNIYPISTFAKIVHDINPSTMFHTDATQAIGKMNVDVQDLGIDYLTLSGHKFHAPKGIGALYAKKPEALTPLIIGGDQENKLRAGTESTILIAALGRAAYEAKHSDFAKIQELRDIFEAKLKDAVPESEILGDIGHRICNTSCIVFPHLRGEAICDLVNQRHHICISTGAACDSRNLQPSHVMNALGRSDIPIRGSLSKFTTSTDIDILLNALTTECKNRYAYCVRTYEEHHLE